MVLLLLLPKFMLEREADDERLNPEKFDVDDANSCLLLLLPATPNNKLLEP